MAKIHLVGTEFLDIPAQLALDGAIEQSLDILAAFGVDEQFEQKITEVFGDRFDAEKLEKLRQSFAFRDWSWLPTFEIRSADELNGANAAFAASNNRVYLSQDFIS
ncbi:MULTISPECIES: hypothetical protein [unclassified Moorena]|uniref:hypothetical protein n=1 Tax=unclassified Moorena TaxID=2683338 RepID=UPI0013BD370B|nr:MULTISPECIES: hypothetical protein [unclassified Moorena]NEQ10781.1 hypothetical protein [Moorena sp. SIO4E2]NES40384.1 hypothetical protein [Moorena sp. SIO2C4]